MDSNLNNAVNHARQLLKTYTFGRAINEAGKQFNTDAKAISSELRKHSVMKRMKKKFNPTLIG
jgi:hypothetical protein